MIRLYIFLTTAISNCGHKGPGKRGHTVADTLLPTQMFLRLPARAAFVADTNFVSGTQKMFLILFRNILSPQQMFPSLHSPRMNIMSNNVSAMMCPRLLVPLSCIYWSRDVFTISQRYTPTSFVGQYDERPWGRVCGIHREEANMDDKMDDDVLLGGETVVNRRKQSRARRENEVGITVDDFNNTYSIPSIIIGRES